MDYTTLYGKTIVELRAVARQYGVKLPAGINKDGIINRLLEAYQKLVDERQANAAGQAAPAQPVPPVTAPQSALPGETNTGEVLAVQRRYRAQVRATWRAGPRPHR